MGDSDSVFHFEVSGETVRLVQITDTHLNRHPGGELLGLDTDYSLQQVVRTVRNERPDIDGILATGDISDHGAPEAYLRAREYFASLSDTVFWLPGNHDGQENMHHITDGGGEMSREVRVGNWQILMLDTQIPGEVGGRLGADQIEWLSQRLAAATEAGLFTLICLHHQPIPMGSAWIDQQMVEDADTFLAVVDSSPSVRGVLWGHVHQAHDSRRGHFRMMCTPSTCIQFAPHNDDFKVDDKPPGYRWLDLHGNGDIDSAVSRVEDAEFSVDLESKGYA
jgi:Icc protein